MKSGLELNLSLVNIAVFQLISSFKSVHVFRILYDWLDCMDLLTIVNHWAILPGAEDVLHA